MNAAVESRPVTPQKGNGRDNELQDAIHLLAQPLTALSFVLDLALLHSEPEAWRQGLEAGRTECRRAIKALTQVRDAATEAAFLLKRHGTTDAAGEIW